MLDIYTSTIEIAREAGGNRRQRHATALGSAPETMACFDVAVAMD